MQKWYVGEKEMGMARTIGPLTFMIVYESGHMVPLDQPEAAQQMFNTFIFNERYY